MVVAETYAAAEVEETRPENGPETVVGAEETVETGETDERFDDEAAASNAGDSTTSEIPYLTNITVSSTNIEDSRRVVQMNPPVNNPHNLEKGISLTAARAGGVVYYAVRAGGVVYYAVRAGGVVRVRNVAYCRQGEEHFSKTKDKHKQLFSYK